MIVIGALLDLSLKTLAKTTTDAADHAMSLAAVKVEGEAKKLVSIGGGKPSKEKRPGTYFNKKKGGYVKEFIFLDKE